MHILRQIYKLPPIIHPLFSTHLGVGCGGSSPSKDAQTSFSLPNYSRGVPRGLFPVMPGTPPQGGIQEAFGPDAQFAKLGSLHVEELYSKILPVDPAPHPRLGSALPVG